MAHRILVIDDDSAIRDTVRLNLSELSCEVETADDGAQGLLRALEHEFQLIVLDVTLPGMNGFDVCRKLRSEKPHIPILMLTSRASEAEVVLGLELGADDYLSKPFRAMELNARVRALLRRSSSSSGSMQKLASGPVLNFGPLSINPEARIASVDNQLLELTALEFDALYFLARNPGKTISRIDMIDHLWGENNDVSDDSINTLVSRLRKKLATGSELITTLRGVGFRFDAPPS